MEEALAIGGCVALVVAYVFGRRFLTVLMSRADRKIRDASRDARWQRSQGRMSALADTARADGCVACESRDLERLAKAAYRCRACGYEGGPGFAALEETRRREAWSSRPVDERKRAAMEDLVMARKLVDAPDPAGRSPGGGYGRSVVDVQLEEGAHEALRHRLLDALGRVTDAETKVQGLGLIPEDLDLPDAVLNARHRDLELLRQRLFSLVGTAMARIAGHRS